MRIVLRDVAGSTVLAGATAGAQMMGKLIARVADSDATIVYLDFQDIEAATGSFLRECVLGFRDYCRRVKSKLYPVFANAPPVVEEEFRELLVATNDAFVSCRITKAGKVSSAKVVGRLDQRQAETLLAVVKARETDASRLSQHSEDIGSTAWNNRLAGLVSKGILIERKSGRQKLYSPVIQDLNYGN
jgi:hypothetical protein